ncbi:MAG: gliding motility-associated C-terminal domain-containing protein [Bacteroidota bacterium]
MIKSFIPFFLILCMAGSLYAQTPEAVRRSPELANSARLLTCPAGVNPDAGTTSQALAPNAQSNDVRYLCWGDMMDITHNQDFDLSGDPNPATQAGIGYIFYECPPTVVGTELSAIEGDPCRITNPAPPGPPFAQFWMFTDPVQFNGNTQFFNENTVEISPGNFISIQDFFNNGDPIEITFAPATIDNFFFNQYETDVNSVQGPCVNVNVNDAFPVVYLNPITISNINPTAGGNGCGVTFTIEGGVPEFDPINFENYSNISVTLDSDPSVEGEFDGFFSHGEVFQVTVPQNGTYNVLIEDGVSCAGTAQFTVSNCVPIQQDIPDVFAPQNSNVCLDVTVQDFVDVVSFQYLIEWDNSILQFTGINDGALSIPVVGPANPTNFISLQWISDIFNPMPVTLNDGDVAFQICFDVIGIPGDVSPVDFTDGGLGLETEVFGTNDFRLSAILDNGSVTVVSDAISVLFGACSTTSNTGRIQLQVTGGTAPYGFTYEEVGNPGNSGTGSIPINGGETEILNLTPGDYTVTITDNAGDVQVVNITVPNATDLIVQVTPMNPLCEGDANGSLDLAVVGGIQTGMPPNYNITWSNMATNVTMIDNLPQGNYSVTVTDAAGCSVVENEGIFTLPIDIGLTNLANISCFGNGMDGEILVSASGGTVGMGSDFDYNWSTGATGPIVSNLSPGNYCVTVTDDNNCIQIRCFDVMDALTPNIINWDSISVTCFNDMNGALTVNAIPTNSPISEYQWTFPDGSMTTTTVNTITGLSAGTYSVTIVADDGCTTVDMATLWAPSPVVIDSLVATPPDCPNLPNPNGSVAAFVSGGNMPYNYEWSNGFNGPFSLLPSLGGGVYIVTVTDANGCNEAIDSIEVVEPPEINIAFTDIESVSCNDALTCDGSATAIASGGTAGTGLYEFQWISGEIDTDVGSSTAFQLCQGLNTLSVNDGECANDTTVFIDAPPALTFNPDSTFSVPVGCKGGSDGMAFVGGAGGTPSYTYMWETGETGSSIDGLSAGSYFVTITDFNGCTTSFDISVTEPDSLIALIDPSNTFDISCNGESDGQVAISPSGGTPPFSYMWSGNVSATSTAVNLPVGQYQVTVTDANNCMDSLSFILSEPDPIIAIIPDPEEPPCFGFQTVITVDTASGGAGGPLSNYTFSVNNGPPRPVGSAIPVFAGSYTVSVFDANGCSLEEIVMVEEPPPVLAVLGDDVEIQLGDSIVLAPQFQSLLPIDSLQWASSGTDTVRCLDSLCSRLLVQPNTTTLYQLTVVDAQGCTGTDDIIVEVDKNRNVFIPNIFTPDNNGANDFFKPFTGPGVQNINFMQVYDRWGEIVYEARNPMFDNDTDSGGWDGTFNGKRMNPGVYVYLIEVVFVDGITLLYRGDVTLLR